MNKRMLTVLTVLGWMIFAVPCVYPLPAAADGPPRLAPEALMPLTRPGAVFDHDAHNEKAGLEENCILCHHSGEKGKLVPGESSEGTPCADCHSVRAESGQTPLRRAYHRQCITCHKEAGRGPAHCSGCHVKTTR